MPRKGVRDDLRGLKWILAAFIMYVVAPLRDVPLLGLSLSAPMFVLIALELTRRGYIKPLLRRNPFLPALSFFLAGLFISTFVNGFSGQSIEVSFERMMHILAAFGYWAVVFLCVSFVLSRTGMRETSLRWVAVAVSVMALLVVAEYALGQAGLQESKGMLTMLTQNEIGIQFSAFGLAPLALAVISKRAQHRLFYFLCAMIVGLAAVVNSSRSSWIALTLGFLVIVTLSRGFRWRSRLVGAGAVGFVLIVGYLAVAPQTMTQKFRTRSATLQNLEHDKSFQARIFLIRKGLKLFSAHPITGVGPGSFRFHQVEGVQAGRSLRSVKEKVNRISAHNSYMMILAEGGLITMVPLVVFLASLGVLGVRQSRRQARAGDPVGIMFLGMFVALSVHLWTLSGLGSSGAWVVYAFVASVVMAVDGGAVGGVPRRVMSPGVTSHGCPQPPGR